MGNLFRYVKIFLIGIFWLASVGGYTQARYWVGGSGNWTDSQHWSVESGGVGGATIPTASNNVYVDGKSFDTPGVIFLDTDASAKSFYWLPVAKGSGLQGTSSLIINGNFQFESAASSGWTGELVLSASSKSYAKVPVSLKNSILFSSNSSYSVVSNLVTSKSVVVKSDAVSFNNNKVKASGITASPAVKSTISSSLLKATQGNNNFFTVDYSTTPVSCPGSSDGSAKVNAVSGGTPPYSYIWLDSKDVQIGTSSSISNVKKEIYTLTVIDALGVSDYISVPIDGPVNLIFQKVEAVDATCNGGNGSVKVSAIYGVPPYTYFLNGTNMGQASPVPGVAAGTYALRIVDKNGCSYNYNTQVTVNEPAAINLTLTSTNVTTCFGNNDGTITATATGGAGTIEYSIDGVNFSSTSTFTGLVAKTYTVSARSSVDHSCVATKTVVVSQPVKLNATAIANPVTGCSVTPDGQIVISGATGGSGTYEYSIDGGATWSATGTFTGLIAKSYNVVIRDKANITCTFTVNANLQVTANPSLTATYSSVDVTCNGSANGSITFTNPQGGSGQYEYSVVNGVWSSTATFSSLVPNTYTLRIRDKNNPACAKDLGTVAIKEPVALSATTSKIDVTGCSWSANGSITVNSPLGGSGTFEFSLNGGAWGTSATFNGLVAGTYAVSMRDKAAPTCIKPLGNVVLTAPQAITSSFTKVDVTGCAGNTNGSITFTATSGGSGAYDYSVDNGVSWGTATTVGSLKAGSYTLWVRDRATPTCSVKIGVANIIEPAPLSATVTPTNAACFGTSTGSINITNAAGGSGQYEYSKDGGVGWQSGTSFLNLTAGSYQVYIRDLNNKTCSKLIATIVITQDASITATVTSTNVTGCNGDATGTITISNTAGGKGGPYEYSTDNVTWKSATTFTGLVAKSYNVFARDISNPSCASQVGTVTITQPTPIVINSITPVNPKCFGAANGTITVSATGGTAPLMYSTGGLYQASTLFSNVSAGAYVVSVKDAGGCVVSQNVTLTNPQKIIPAKIDIVNIGCTNTTGSINVDPAGLTGGVAPFQYSIYSGTAGTYSNNQLFTGLVAGNYNVRVMDANSCESDIIPVTVSSSTILDVSVANVVDVKPCKGNATGSIVLNIKSGTAPYLYNIGAGDKTLGASNSIDNLLAGTYNVLVKDATGCTKTLTNVVVREPAAALAATFTKTDVTACPDNGTIVVNVTGGVSPYSFSKDNGVTYIPVAVGITSYTFGNLGAATYAVKVKDSNGCIFDIGNVSIVAPSKLTLTVTPQNIDCFGGAGAINASATGGTPPYQFSVGTGPYSPTSSFPGLAAGNYTINVKDNGGCSDSKPTILSQPTSAVTATVTGVDITCNGANDGHITVVATGGTPTYTITLNPGNVQVTGGSADYKNLSAGTYTVTVLDAKCLTPFTKTVTISEPAAVSIALGTPNVTQPTCATPGAISITSTVTLNPAGGSLPTVTYQLMQGATVVATSTTGAFNNVAPGSYTINAFASSCTNVVSPTIVVNNPSASSLALAINGVTQIKCFGDGGVVDGQVTGGTLPYGPNINVTITPVVPLTFNKADGKIKVSNLAAGSYTLTLSESGCNQTQNVTINNGPASSVVLGTPTVVRPTTATSTDGSISVTASGGTPGYQYTLTPASAVNPNPSTTGIFGGLGVNNYTVSAVDSKGCAAIPINVVLSNIPPAVTSNAVGTNITCNGSGNGKIDITIPTGVAPFVINVVSTGTTVAPITTSNATYTITGLAKGNYTVSVTDANATTSAPQVITITEPTPIAIGLSNITTTLCSGSTAGKIDVAVNGGTTPYASINWVGDNGLNGNISGAAGTMSNLTAGNYTITVTDASGCIATKNQQIKENPAITLAAVKVDPTCANPTSGKITLTATGGTTPPAFTYTKDGITFTNTTGIFTTLAAGNYVVAAKDGVGCISPTQNITLLSPSTITINSIVKTDAHCAVNGTITAVATGGAAPLTYRLLRSGSLIEISSNSTGHFVDVPAGKYVVQVTDGVTTCPATSAIQTIAAGGTSSIQEEKRDVASIKCFGGTGTFTVWAKGVVGTIHHDVVDVATGATLNEGVDYNFSATAGVSAGEYTVVLNNVKAGHYALHVWDDNSCPQRFEFVLKEPGVLKIDSFNFTDPKSNHSNDGTITVVASGGLPPYTYSLYDDGGNFIVNTDDGIFTGLAPGNYMVQVKGQGDCEAWTPVITLTAQSNLTIDDVLLVAPKCHNETNGSIEIFASGGVGNLQYSIDNGVTFQANRLFSNLPAGTYTVVVMDDAGVTATQLVTLNNPDELKLTLVTQKLPSGTTAADGSITVIASGGTPLYTITIIDKATGKDFMSTVAPSVEITLNNLYSGTYIVTATDINGCTAVIDPVELLRLTVTGTAKDVDCSGTDSGKIDVSIKGGSTPYKLSWQVAGGTVQGPFDVTGNSYTIDKLPVGIYTVTVVDMSGASKTLTKEIKSTSNISLTVGTITDVLCNGDANGSVTFTVKGELSGLKVALNGNDITASGTGGVFTASNLPGGVATIIATNDTGCSVSKDITVGEPQKIVVNAKVTSVPTNPTDKTGIIVVDATGGTPVYSYELTNLADGITTAPQPTNTFNGLAFGKYVITVKDKNGCSGTDTVEVNKMVVTAKGFGATCTDNFGKIEVSITNGAVDYTIAYYKTSDLTNPVEKVVTSATTHTFTNVALGDYKVIVVDNSGESSTVDVTISGYQQPVIAVTHVCHVKEVNAAAPSYYIELSITPADLTNYTISCTDEGGVSYPDYDPVLKRIRNVLPNKTYTIVLNEAGGCSSAPITQAVAEIATVLEAKIDKVNNVLCHGDNTGSIIVKVTSIEAPQTIAAISWTDPTKIETSLTDTVKNLIAGKYNVKITDVKGCYIIDTATVKQPLSALKATFIADSSNIFLWCKTESDGKVLIKVEGGTAGYQFDAALGAKFTSKATLPVEDTVRIYKVPLGDLIYNVKDANGCTLKNTVTLTARALNAKIDLLQASKCRMFINPSDKAKDGGMVEISNISGDYSGAAKYYWTPLFKEGIVNSVSTPDANGYYSFVAPQKDNITQLQGVKYFFNIKVEDDDKGALRSCIVSDSVEVGVSPAYDFRAVALPKDTVCINSTVKYTAGIIANSPAAALSRYWIGWSNDFGSMLRIEAAADILDEAVQEKIRQIVTINKTMVTKKMPYKVKEPKVFWVISPDNICFDLDTAKVSVYPFADPNFVGDKVKSVNDVDFVRIPINGQQDFRLDYANPVPDGILSKPVWDPKTADWLKFDEADSTHFTLLGNFDKDVALKASVFYKINDKLSCEEYANLRVIPLTNINPPNAFTPNGDGFNDTWRVLFDEEINEYPQLEVLIFNRWGSLVFQAKPYKNDWNGKNNGVELPIGTYYYVIKPHRGGLPNISGAVSIIR